MQKRDAWCRSCGSERRYATGWSPLSPSALATLQDAPGSTIGRGRGCYDLPDGTIVARLRLRQLPCEACGTVGTLVAGRRPVPLGARA